MTGFFNLSIRICKQHLAFIVFDVLVEGNHPCYSPLIKFTIKNKFSTLKIKHTFEITNFENA